MKSISIHALREESDQNNEQVGPHFQVFQSTPSARRATDAGELVPFYVDISIHALREESDSRQKSA